MGMPALLGEPGAILLVAVFAALTQWEIYTLIQKMGPVPKSWIGVATGLGVSIGSYFALKSGASQTGIFGVAVTVIVIAHLAEKPADRKLSAIGATLFGLVLAPMLLTSFSRIYLVGGAPLALWVIAIIKFTDVGGLLTGMAIGKHKLSPNLSPKKTWEGVIGGILSSMLIGSVSVILFREYFPGGLTPLLAAVIAAPTAAVGVCADLFESAMKREAKVKDSGKLIPGIGGAFDLTDSLILGGPVALALIEWMVL